MPSTGQNEKAPGTRAFGKMFPLPKAFLRYPCLTHNSPGSLDDQHHESAGRPTPLHSKGPWSIPIARDLQRPCLKRQEAGRKSLYIQ